MSLYRLINILLRLLYRWNERSAESLANLISDLSAWRLTFRRVTQHVGLRLYQKTNRVAWRPVLLGDQCNFSRSLYDTDHWTEDQPYSFMTISSLPFLITCSKREGELEKTRHLWRVANLLSLLYFSTNARFQCQALTWARWSPAKLHCIWGRTLHALSYMSGRRIWWSDLLLRTKLRIKIMAVVGTSVGLRVVRWERMS